MKKRIKDILNVTILIAISFTIWFLLNEVDYTPERASKFYVDIPEEYPVLGMDVSHHQGEIDWDEVRHTRDGNDSIKFVYIKATEGLDLEDKNKRDNAEGARSVQIDYGFYHYFIPTKSAIKQADFFCDETGGYNYDLRPVVDVEEHIKLSTDDLRDSVVAFLDRVETRLGSRPIIYTNADYYINHLRELDEEYWIAHYTKDSPYIESNRVLCWQFSDKGKVKGVSVKVDLNVAKSSYFKKIRK